MPKHEHEHEQERKPQGGPRETAAGLQVDGETQAPPTKQAPRKGEVNPDSQKNMFDDRSSPDEQSIHAKSQTSDKVTPEGLQRSRTAR